jgi:hypothetical protein
MPASCSKLLLAGAVWLVVASPGCGQRSERDLAEQKAIERHEQDIRQRAAFQSTIKQVGVAKLTEGARFLVGMARSGRIPGLSRNAHGTMRMEKLPVITPNGPYYLSAELHLITSDAPPKNYFYAVVQTYSNGGFQLQKAWRADASGKVLEEYPIAPAPPRADARRVFLGPANAGAESGWSGWYNGTLGGGFVAIDTDDPATGVSCFSIGISNAVPGETHHADFRSEPFSLGRAGPTRQPIALSFAYKLPGKVKPGDNIQVFFRFFDQTGTNCLDQEMVRLGSNTGDSEMRQYKTMTLADIFAPRKAVTADIWVAANISDEPWTSGAAQFDDFLVTAGPARFRATLYVGAAIFAVLAALLIRALRTRRLSGKGGPAGRDAPGFKPEVGF